MRRYLVDFLEGIYLAGRSSWRVLVTRSRILTGFGPDRVAKLERSEGMRCSVAGVGFEPTTFGL